MSDYEFKHKDEDSSHDDSLSLHDCVAEKIEVFDGCLRFVMPDGFWITPKHKCNNTKYILKTDASVVDFRIDDIDDIIVRVFTRGVNNRKTNVEFWKIIDLIRGVNNGDYSIEFVYQYRSYFEQMWYCAIHSKKKPYYKECQLHIPQTEAVYRWDDLRPEYCDVFFNDCIDGDV